MISRNDIQALVERPDGGVPVLSVLLDMSVNSENKRTYRIFLNKERGKHAELASDREGHHPEELGEAFARVDRWLDNDYQEASKGAAIYTEIGGDWFEAHQLSVPLNNNVHIGPRPRVGPLLEVFQSYHQHGVVLVDREHLRMVSIFMDRALHEHKVDTEPYPAPHDVQRGGYSAPDFQRRKAEEVRHFFKEFALEVGEFFERYRPDDLILLGTDENVRRFEEFLSAHVREKVVHTAHAPVDAPTAHILERLRPFFEQLNEQETAAAVDVLRERVGQDHMATSGFHRTLEQLQEGKVETLVVGRGLEREGAKCEKCGFFLVRRDAPCPYCGGEVRDGIDLPEEMVRMAAEQAVTLEFVPPDAISDFDGIGALLRF